MSTMYTPLKASRREVRLISIRPDLNKLDGSNMPRDSIPEGTLICTMKTVSLKDWTSDYAAFRAKAIDWPYSPTTLYEKWEHFSREKAGCTDDDRTTPDRFVWGDYETISYTWENGSNTQHTISVNDRPFVVQDNLYQALQEFRKGRDFVEGRTRMLWADAICINQDDLDERATEVKRMNEIFSTAIKSTVWLGASLDLKGADTQVYFDLIGRLIDDFYRTTLPDDSSINSLQRASTETVSSGEGYLDEHDPEHQESHALSEKALAVISQFDPAERPPISALETLHPDERLEALLFPIFRLDYWNRVWIIQELTISSSHTVVRAGSSQISFARLSWFAEWYSRDSTFDSSWSPNDEYTRNIMNTFLLLKTIYQVQLQLGPDEWKTSPEQMLIRQGLMSRSSLPLDKLYGVLGLLQPSAYLGIDVDYRKTVRQGSIDAAIAWMRAGKSLKTFDIRREFQNSRVPCWAVDLSIDQDPMSSMAAHFWVRGPAKIPEVDWEIFWESQVGLRDQGILSLEAKHLETVDGVAACVPLERRSLESWSPKLTPPRAIDYSTTQLTRLYHSYSDDSEMLACLDAILRNVPNWETEGLKSRYYAEGSPDVFKLSTLAEKLELSSDVSSESHPLGVSAATARGLSSLKQFLDASADFELWKEKLSLLFPGIGQKPGSPISASHTSDLATLLDTDGSQALEDMMQHVNMWTLSQVRLITTTSGYLGMAAQLVKQGDMIYAVEGYGCPVILRPIENADTFEFIGLAEVWSPAVSGTWENMTFYCIVRLQ
ncbi:Heterokaryon incompatibility protein 6, OR allele [Colletotrichum siamense]|uniref:Heterokaryon incompatibility protein 6, OR allele n=1 Tax=Colletotrichum siamense TaxID=690259 RepID=UPI00187230F8|nr:Heterokaryon incompatibility protein 6, OR allele [Colletotrichum siamense]KAF5498021.1 Heterokaryon incompatibility protein 6, OR allele [Colletotrichum siamense]